MEIKKIDLLNAAGRLPSPNGVALRLLRLISSDTVSAQEIAQTIRSDPALAGRVIGAANTSAHHGQRAVVSVLEALARIGTAATCRLALGLSLIAEHREGHCHGFDYQRYWARSLVMALTMQALARRTHTGSPEELFTVGLLAEVGQLALATLHPDTYGTVRARVADFTDIAAQVAAERNAYATDRFELAQTLLTDWGFPEIFLESVALLHRDAMHDPAPGPRRHLMACGLRIATRIADCSVDFDLGRDAAGDLALLGAPLELAAEELQVVWNEVAVAWPTWTRLLELDMPELSPLELSPRPTLAQPSATAKPPLRILAVTENAQVRHMLTTLFESGNVTLRVAENDEAAFHAAVNDE